MDFDKFRKAAEAWRKEHCSSPGAARAKLREMGMIDENGNLTPEYSSPPDLVRERRIFFGINRG